MNKLSVIYNKSMKVSYYIFFFFLAVLILLYYRPQREIKTIKAIEQKYLQYVRENPTVTKEYYEYHENILWDKENHQQLLQKNKINQDNSVIYLFWTGGFDSTFRLVQLLLKNNNKTHGLYVQPIYIMCPMLDSVFGFKRKNKEREIKTMKQIREALYYKYPHYQKYLLPTRYVTSVYIDIEVTKKYMYISALKRFTRGISQYERLAQYSYKHPRPIELGLEKCGTGMDKMTQNYRIGNDINNKVDLKKAPKEYIILKNLSFPISNLTKEDMVKISKDKGFYFVLEMSWTCWFPKNDNLCGKCDMCRHRII